MFPAQSLLWSFRDYLAAFLLLLRRSFLRSLQRIQRCASGEAATLTRRSLCLRNQNVSITRAGDRALHHQQVVLNIDAADAKVADRDLCVAHRSEEHTSEL